MSLINSSLPLLCMKCGWGLSVWLLSPADVFVPREGEGRKGQSEARSSPRVCPLVALGAAGWSLGAGGVGHCCASTGHQALPGEVENCREAPSLLAAGPHTPHTPAESRCPNSVFRQTQFISSRCWVLPLASLPAGTTQGQPQGQQEPSHASPGSGAQAGPATAP